MVFLSKLFTKEKKASLDQGLKKTHETFFKRLSKVIVGKSRIDDETLDHLEEVLMASDVGIQTTLKIIDQIQKRAAKDKFLNADDLNRILKEEIIDLLSEAPLGARSDFEIPENIKPYVIMVVGVNGSGKTTTIGKLASQFRKKGKSVILGAADTFRAAAISQLQLWGDRTGATVIAKGMNTDPSAVAYDTVKQGIEKKADVILIDTAGRLHTKVNLMNELSKIERVIQKAIPNAPHDVLLVLDGSAGQNAAVQAHEFTKATTVTGIAITKLDGTAKGGVVIGISNEFKIPVQYIGIGEQPDDLHIFNRVEFVDSLFKEN